MKQKPTPGGIGMKLPPDLMERLQQAACWTTPTHTISEIVRAGIAREVNWLADRYRADHNGAEFPPPRKKGRKP